MAWNQWSRADCTSQNWDPLDHTLCHHMRTYTSELPESGKCMKGTCSIFFMTSIWSVCAQTYLRPGGQVSLPGHKSSTERLSREPKKQNKLPVSSNASLNPAMPGTVVIALKIFLGQRHLLIKEA